MLCTNCKNELAISFEFKEKCLKTQEKLEAESNNVFIKVETLDNILDDNSSAQGIKIENSLIKDCTGDFPLPEDSSDTFGLDNGENYVPEQKDNSLKGAEESEQNVVSTQKKKSSNPKVTSKDSKNNGSKKKIMCHTCGKLLCKALLSEHIRLQHSGLPLEEICYTCDLCSSRIKHKPSLILHMKMFHQQHFDRSKTCELCGEVFRNGQHLLYHKRKVHTDLFPLLQCKYCDHKTPYSSKFKLHMLSHLGEASMKHECNICGRKFLQARRLRDHKATHSDRRDFVCKECGSSFKTAGGLSVHVKGVHSAKGYECPVCSREFSTNQNLRFHVTKQHPDYSLPPPGTVLKKNAVRPFVFASGFSLASNHLQTSTTSATAIKNNK